MIIERVEIPVKPGQEEAFAKAMVEGCKILASGKGCHGAECARGVESPGKFLLLLRWDSVDAHIAFTKTPEMDKFRALAGPFFADKPAMEHFKS